MKHPKRSLPFFLGICLIACSLFLMLFSQLRIHMGSRNCAAVVSRLNEILPDRTQGIPGLYSTASMPTLEIDGTDYAAILEIPSFGVKVPVADEWNSSKLTSSPARFFGSTYDHTLIIGGEDNPNQFAFCDQIELDALVRVTDMTGAQFSYSVSRVDRAKHADSQWLVNEN